jgi:uroporphyrinogen III methyltransferase/synthase
VLDLRGKTVVLTRAHGDNVELARRLERAGARTVELPCLRIEALGDRRALDGALAGLRPKDWLVVTSRHGADAVTLGPRTLARVAAIGAATSARLRERGVVADFMPSVPTGECLARELAPRSGGGVLLARSDRALADLPAQLRARGFAVREVTAYRTVPGVQGDARDVRARLRSDAGSIAIAVSSPSALDALVAELGADLVSQATLLAGGPTTARIARDRLGPLARIELTGQEAAHAAHG